MKKPRCGLGFWRRGGDIDTREGEGTYKLGFVRNTLSKENPRRGAAAGPRGAEQSQSRSEAETSAFLRDAGGAAKKSALFSGPKGISGWGIFEHFKGKKLLFEDRNFSKRRFRKSSKDLVQDSGPDLAPSLSSSQFSVLSQISSATHWARAIFFLKTPLPCHFRKSPYNLRTFWA